MGKENDQKSRCCNLSQVGSTCGTANNQDFAAGTAEGMGEFCADAAAGFFAPSSQLYLLVLSKMR
jgi:hypothetical protein